MKINFKIMILLMFFSSLLANTYCMHSSLQQRVNDLHISLTQLATKLKTLSNGLKTIKNKLAGIEEPDNEKIEDESLNELIDAIKKVVFIAPSPDIQGDACSIPNNTLNNSFNEAYEKITALKNMTIADDQRLQVLEELNKIRQAVKIKYQEKLDIGDTSKDTGANTFNEIVNKIKNGTADYNSVLSDFLIKDTTSLRNTSGYNAIQVTVHFMDMILENESVDANQVLNDALGSMQFRTQTLILFYILLKNNFFNDAEFLHVVANSILGYIGQIGFDHLGMCLVAQLLEKIPNTIPSALSQLTTTCMNYDKNIISLSNQKPNPKINKTNFNNFQYYLMEFSGKGLEAKSDLLRFILALQAELAILELHEHKPAVIDEPIIDEPVAPEPGENLVKKISDEIKIAAAHVPGAAGFPVPKFKTIIAAMQANLNQNLLTFKEAQGTDILGYFKLFTQKGHQYFMKSAQLKTSYQQMLSLCTIIVKNIFQSKPTFEALMLEYQKLTLLTVFTNFLFNIPQADFAAIDNPAFDPVHDRLKKENLNNFSIFKPNIQTYEHKGKNMLKHLINWFDDAQRATVQDFFTKMPQMGKTIVFQSAFNQLEEALNK